MTSANTTIIFTPFHLVYGLEATVPIECEIPSLKLVVELLLNTSPKEWLLYLERLDETYHIATLVIKAKKKHVKAHFFFVSCVVSISIIYIENRIYMQRRPQPAPKGNQVCWSLKNSV